MGRPSFLTVLSLLAASAARLAVGADANDLPRRSDSTCADVHIFLARGNNEPYPGRQSQLVMAVCDGLSSCDYEDLIYSSLYTDEYCKSAYWGTVAGHVQMAQYASRCPNSKLILGGYSQGAQVAMDILGGGGGTLYNGCVQPSTPALSRKNAPGSMIVAAIVFGNVRHTAGQSYDFGNGSSINGYFPRTSEMMAALDDYADILRDWCQYEDPVCAFGQGITNVAAHLAYYDNYAKAAASWIKSVASLTDNSDFTTYIPTQVSGYAQDYATIGTATPSGDVTLNTLWTLSTSVVAAAATTTSSASTAPKTTSSVASSTTSASASSTSSSMASSSGSSVSTSSTSSPSTTSSTVKATITSSAATTTAAASTPATSAAASATTSSSAGVRGKPSGFGPLIFVLAGTVFLV